MNSSPGNYVVRGSYLATAVFAPVLAALPAGFELYATFSRPAEDWLGIATITFLLFCLYVSPSVRAIRRLIASGTVIPPELVDERPVVSFVVTVFGGFGHLLFLFTMAGAIGIALAPEWPEEGKKILGPVLLGLMCYFIALWCGELALVGNGISDKARASRSAAL